jgi:putative transposase
MLTQTEYQNWKRRLGLTERAETMIDEIRRTEPIRRVGGGAGNVATRYPSRKMGRVIQAESHQVELPAVHWMEQDDAVLEYYDQPCKIELEYESKKGRSVRVKHTPDFFVMKVDWAGWEEWKTDEGLNELMTTTPNRYCRNEQGRWHCPPGENYAARAGLEYRVRASSEINWIFQRNVQFFDDYWRTSRPFEHSEEVGQQVKRILESGGRSLEEIFDGLPGVKRDLIYWLIANREIYFDLQKTLITHTKQAMVFLSKDQERLSARRECPDEKLQQVDGLLVITEQPEISASASQSRLTQASPSALAEALRRYQIIEPLLKGEETIGQIDSDSTSTRTIKRWKCEYMKAQTQSNEGLVGLLPQTEHRGNRGSKLSERVKTLMNEYITKYYETSKQRQARVVYGQLDRACQANGERVPAYSTFLNAIKSRPRHEQTEKRKGKRAAYKYQPFHWQLTMTTPRHGDRPMEIAHIDHTELDIELVCSRTGKNLGRPWATFLMDSFSRRLLAVVLSYDAPSYRACMAVLRECVRRHGRLPQILVVDGGREFGSVYFETLLARYECVKKTRPAAQSRFGSVCERLFSTANTTFIHNLEGNTQIMRNVRQVTKSMNPKHHAVWTLGDLYPMICEWAYEKYDTLEHPSLGETPREAFQRGLAESGERTFRAIDYNEDFIMATLPTTAKGTVQIRSDQGVMINRIRYWSDAFRNSEMHLRQAHVRYDPYDISVAYVFLNDRWVQCRSEHAMQLAGYSKRALDAITQEILKRNQMTSKKYQVTAARIAEFIDTVETTETVLKQRLQDLAHKDVLSESEKAWMNPQLEITSEIRDAAIKKTKTHGVEKLKVDRKKLVVYGEY